MYISKANIADATTIHELAHQIYHPTYHPILSNAQMEFMLENIYSIKTLAQAMLTDQDFYVLKSSSNEALGFIALHEKSESILRIEKLYLLPSTQGKGCGRELIDFAKAEALNRSKNILELNVNRRNKAYYFYLNQGFKVTEEVDIPYFGFILDDYIMQMSL